MQKQKYATDEERMAAIRATKRAYYERNKEKYNAICRDWHKAHYDPVKKHAYYERRKEEARGAEPQQNN